MSKNAAQLISFWRFSNCSRENINSIGGRKEVERFFTYYRIFIVLEMLVIDINIYILFACNKTAFMIKSKSKNVQTIFFLYVWYHSLPVYLNLLFLTVIIHFCQFLWFYSRNAKYILCQFIQFIQKLTRVWSKII